MFYVKNYLSMIYADFPSGNMEGLHLQKNIGKFVKSGKIYEAIYMKLKDQYPDCCGLSARSVRHFCRDHQINKRSLPKKRKLDSIVKEEVLQVIVYVFTFIK